MSAAPFDQCNCLAVRQAARRITQVYDAHLASFGLRSTQYSILNRLDLAGALSINELAAGMVMDRTTLGRALRPLERDGLISVGAGRDGRTRALSLTAAGREKLKAARVAWRSAQAAFESTYGRDAAAALRERLRDVVAAIDAAR